MDAANERNTYENRSLKRLPSNISNEWGSKRSKRIKTNEENGYTSTAFSTTSWRFEADKKQDYTCSKLSDYSDPFFLKMEYEFDSGRFGSVSEKIEELIARRRQVMDVLYARDPSLLFTCSAAQNDVVPEMTKVKPEVIELDLDDDEEGGTSFSLRRIIPATQNINSCEPVVIDLDDSDDDATKSDIPTCQYVGLNLPKPSVPVQLPSAPGKLCMKDFVNSNFSQIQSTGREDACNAGRKRLNAGGKGVAYNDEGKKDAYSVEEKVDAYDAGGKGDSKNDSKIEIIEDKGEYVGTDEEGSDEMSDTNPDDGLGDIWNQMNAVLECSKDAIEDAFLNEHEAEFEEDCEHIFILKDDIGDVCRICGVIRRGIETIIEYNFSKNTRSTRTYKYEGRTPKEIDQSEVLPDNFKPAGDFTAADINPHPRHRKEMKPHQIEGFNFLLSNLVTDNPGGCIMAHAPGSGKTFMIISFLQSFMAKYPAARPLVILPKGILTIWKKEFTRWQVEDLPLYDFYSVKADTRDRQLEVLKAWEQERSILFLGYMQFSSIICDVASGPVASACQNYLLKIPSILILDEGHTPRNQDTDVLTSLERVETTRKVVLSGTLYQNHVKEVFNILNLVRPRFLKLDNPKVIKKRILSMVEISGRRNFLKENDFYELIEQTLTKDENYTRKENVIRELREMTKSVLHYYKGDNLDELPGLVDFSVFLRLKPNQQAEVKQLRALQRKFTISAQGSAIYVHPKLKTLSKNTGVKDRVDEEKIDATLEKFDVREGVKANFYLNLLRLCESNGEKMLVFSQYLLPLKFLERLTAKVRGYSLGREMFMITGDADAETREISMEKFNNSPDARVFFGSIKACGEGISLVGASRIMILDVPLNPSVTRQAIGRAFRPGQVRKVYTYRLIASETPEEDDHNVCFRKESIAKMWFEWDSFSGNRKFEMDAVEVSECGDEFLENGRLNEDIVRVLKR